MRRATPKPAQSTGGAGLAGGALALLKDGGCGGKGD